MKKNIEASRSVPPPSLKERRRRAVELTARLVVAEHRRRQRVRHQAEEAGPVSTAWPTHATHDCSGSDSGRHDVPTGA